MQGKGPLVSVCCAAFNHEHCIEQALSGILAQQTDFSFELIVHDDASNDSTLSIVDAYAEAYPAIIRVIRQQENQWSRGRRILPEFMLPKTRGEYIAICEGDDYWSDPGKLRKQVAFLEQNPGYVICYTNCSAFRDDGQSTAEPSGVRWDLTARELQCAPPIFTLTACFRNVLKEWPPELSRGRYGDLLMWSLLGDYGKGKYLGDIGPSRYRVHDAGIHSMRTRSARIEMALETFMVMFLYRMRKGDRAVAVRYLQDIVVLALKLEKHRLFYGIGGRTLNRFRQRIFGRRSSSGSNVETEQ
ncbi:MAG: glycosyltransferase [Pseudomonadota bacterium]